MPRLGRSYPVNRIYRGKGAKLTPTFDALGAGQAGASNTWSHTAAAGSYVIAAFVAQNAWGTLTSVTYGASTMTLLGSKADGAARGTMYFYSLSGAPGGAQTITANGLSFLFGNSVSYKNVSSAVTQGVNDGGTTSTALSQSVTCSSSQAIVQSFADANFQGIGSYSGGTAQWQSNPGTGGAMILNTATATTTFTATLTGGADNWQGLAAVLS